jgi:hypothetical protein
VLIGGLGYVRASRVLASVRPLAHGVAQAGDLIGCRCRNTRGNRRKMMQKLGYVTAITMAAAGAALGVMAVRSLPDVRRYVAMKKM